MRAGGGMEPRAEGPGSPGSSPLSSAGGSPPHRNPSPAPSDEEPEGLSGDCIGGTAYSRRWLLGALSRLAAQGGPGGDAAAWPAALDASLEAELCELWDMSADAQVARALLELEAPRLLLAALAASPCPRLVEICLGVLGNMACFPEPCAAISGCAPLGRALLQLLAEPDPPTLLEAARLLLTCLSREPAARAWLPRVRRCPALRGRLCFIMCSSTSAPLLRQAAQLTHRIFDLDEGLMRDWIRGEPAPPKGEPEAAPGEPEAAAGETEEPEEPEPGAALQLVPCLLEAAAQLHSDGPDGLDVYVHLLQLLTTVDEGVRALLQPAEVGRRAWRFLAELLCRELCQPDDPPVIVQEQAAVLASVLAVLSAMFSSRADEEYLSAGRNLPLLRGLTQVLQHMDECQPSPPLSGAEESEHGEDFHMHILRDICCEFISNIVVQLSKEDVSEGLKHGHLNEQKCSCVIRNLLPLYPDAAQSFTAALHEADAKLAQELNKHCPRAEDLAL